MRPRVWHRRKSYFVSVQRCLEVTPTKVLPAFCRQFVPSRIVSLCRQDAWYLFSAAQIFNLPYLPAGRYVFSAVATRATERGLLSAGVLLGEEGLGILQA